MGVLTAPVWACAIGTVRDAGFQGDRNVHRMCIIANTDDASAQEMYDRLATWLRDSGEEMNIDLFRVNADDPGVLWSSFGIPSAPPSLPVVALVGLSPATRMPFIIDYWEPGPSDEDLATLESSPVRDRIKEEVVDAWAVLLYSPGKASDENASQAALDAVSAKWSLEQPQGVTIIRLDRNDPRERLLCAFTGIEPSGPDWAAVVFGRGKLMAPPLLGDDINENNLNRLIEGLTVPCTCLQDQTALGFDIPMTWDDTLDTMVAALAPPIGYVEIPIEEQLAALEAEVPDEEGRMLYATLISLATVAAAAVCATGFMIWRGTRRSDLPGAE